MKKIILGISVIGVLVANADMSAQEKAFASGIGNLLGVYGSRKRFFYGKCYKKWRNMATTIFRL